MDIESKITLFYTICGVLVGCASAFVPNSWTAFFLALIFFYVSYKLTPKVFNLVENPPRDSSAGGLIKLGILPYFLMWLIFWILVYTMTF